MQRTYDVLAGRAGLVATMATLLLLTLPGTSIAGGASQSTRSSSDATAGLLQQGAGYGGDGQAPRVRALQRKWRRNGLRPGPIDGRYGPRTEAAVIRLQRRQGLPAKVVVDARPRRVLAAAPQRRGGRPADRRTPSRSQLPRPTAVALTGMESGEDQVGWFVLTALLALALGAAAGLLAGRLRPGPSHASGIALARGVVAEGMARAASVGRFRGHVHALVLGKRGLRGTQQARYLISDPEKALPFWVDQEEIDRLGREEAEEKEEKGKDRQDAAPSQAPPDDQPAISIPDQTKVLGYVSVEQNGDPGAAALRRQAQSIDELCRRRGWELLELVRDVETAGGGSLKRPGLTYAIEQVAKGEASCIVVSELSRLTNSAVDLSRVLDSLARSRARLVVMDVGLDTASDAGRIAANSLLRVGSWERQRVLESTGKGLAGARARRAAAGLPSMEDIPALKQRILEMRGEGMTLQAIADQLNEEGIPTIRGGQLWRPSSVQAALGYRRPRRRRDEGEHAM